MPVDNHAAAPKRPRGRPPKVKRGSLKPALGGSLKDPSVAPSPSASSRLEQKEPATSLKAPDSSGILKLPSLSSDDEAMPSGSKRPSRDDDDYKPPSKRICTETPVSTNLSASYSSVRKSKSTILPARRSARQATIQSTQISEGTLRPPGPPCLEAALSIALRNLESETWRYLWSYNKKHRGDPLPTPAAVKLACPRVRRAAEAVDKADRELEDAIDEIMRDTPKKKHRGGAKRAEKRPDTDPTREGSQDTTTEDTNPTSIAEKDRQSGVERADDESTFGSSGLSDEETDIPVRPAKAPPRP